MLDNDSVKTWHAVVLLFVFWVMWLFAGYEERKKHEAFFNEVDGFIHEGERFTADDGRKLKARIEAIEDELDRELGQK